MKKTIILIISMLLTSCAHTYKISCKEGDTVKGRCVHPIFEEIKHE